MQRRWTVLLACACAPTLAACSLLLGEGFTDPNAANKETDASAPDALAEGGADGANPQIEGGPGTDGSPANDAGGDADGGGNGGCPAATVSFCDAFERDDPKGSWDSVLINAGGTLVVGKPAFGSRRLESTVIAANGQAQMMKAFATTPTKVHFELMLQVSTLPQNGGIYIGGVSMPNGAGAPSLLYLYVNETALYFVEQLADGGGYVGTTVGFSTGSFHRVVIDVQFAGNTVVSVDSVTKVNKAAADFLVPKPMEIYLGGSSIDGVGKDVGLLIDDFVFTAD